jgi:hypothetical protein
MKGKGLRKIIEGTYYVEQDNQIISAVGVVRSTISTSSGLFKLTEFNFIQL